MCVAHIIRKSVQRKKRKNIIFICFFSFLALPQFNGESCLKITPPLQCYFVVFHFFLNRPKFTFIVHRVYQKPYIQLYTQMMIFSRKFRNLFVLCAFFRTSLLRKIPFYLSFFQSNSFNNNQFSFRCFY